MCPVSQQVAGVNRDLPEIIAVVVTIAEGNCFSPSVPGNGTRLEWNKR